MEDARSRIETKVLIRGDSRLEPALSSGPLNREHVVFITEYQQYSAQDSEISRLPVKVRPKTNCSGGTKVFGVVVSVIERSLGLRSGNFSSSAS